MKNILAIVALTVLSASAFAGEGGPPPSVGQQNLSAVSQQQQAQQAAAQASNAGNVQGVTVNSYGSTIPTSTQQAITSNSTSAATLNQTVNGETTSNQVVSGGTDSTIHQEFGTQKIKNTPSVSASPLVSSNDTCMGSASASLNFPGVGVGFGKTYLDSNCVMLKNSRELWNMGMKAAAMALMCTDSANKEALEISGYECPQTARDRERKQTASQ